MLECGGPIAGHPQRAHQLGMGRLIERVELDQPLCSLAHLGPVAAVARRLDRLAQRVTCQGGEPRALAAGPLIEAARTANPEALKELAAVEVRRGRRLAGSHQSLELKGIDPEAVWSQLEVLALDSHGTIQQPAHGVERLRKRVPCLRLLAVAPQQPGQPLPAVRAIGVQSQIDEKREMLARSEVDELTARVSKSGFAQAVQLMHLQHLSRRARRTSDYADQSNGRAVRHQNVIAACGRCGWMRTSRSQQGAGAGRHPGFAATGCERGHQSRHRVAVGLLRMPISARAC